MRYMFLIYSREAAAATPEELQAVAELATQTAQAHAVVMNEAFKKGIFRGAEPLKPTSTATTFRTHNGKVATMDGPFAETKEQLAGYYILECEDLDEAIEWAKKIPTTCKGGEGAIEIRPLIEIAQPPFETE